MKNNIFFTIYFLMLIFTSCKKDDEIIDPINSGTIINKIDPTGNDLINFQTIFGNESNQSVIYQMRKDNNGNFYYQGKKNGKYVIGKLNTSGSVIWDVELNFKINDLLINKWLDSPYIIVVGNTIDDNPSGVVAVYDTNGTFISDEVWNNYNTVFFNGISQSLCAWDDNDNPVYFYTIIGGAGNTTIFPYITNFHISTTSKIIKTFPTYFSAIPDKLFSDYPEMRFDKIIQKEEPCVTDIIGKKGGNGYMQDFDQTFYATTYTIQNNEYVNFSVSKFTENVIIDENTLEFNIDWITKITSNSSIYKTVIGNICSYDNDIYIAGKTEVTSESKKSDYWTAGLVAKLNSDGEILWKSINNITENSDGYTSCLFFENYLYAVGYAGLYRLTNDNVFEYGLISKISSTSGNVISDKLIGQKEYRSKINTGLLHNGKIFTGGLTKSYKFTDDAPYQSWFVEFNQNEM